MQIVGTLEVWGRTVAGKREGRGTVVLKGSNSVVELLGWRRKALA